jgi:type II secretory pathway component GspD/PulD (secretin)
MKQGSGWLRSFVFRAVLGMCVVSVSGIALAQDSGGVAPKPNAMELRVFHLKYMTEKSEALDLLTNLRNMLGRAALYYVGPQNAISVRGDAASLVEAATMIDELDRPRKEYRVTYSVVEQDGGKRVGDQSFSVVLFSGEKTNLKEGSRVPVVTGTSGAAGQQTQFQYLDIGLAIEAQATAFGDGIQLQSKLSQTNLAEERPATVEQDPVIRQTELTGTVTLVFGKALVLGALDVPGSTRHREVQVVAEEVR